MTNKLCCSYCDKEFKYKSEKKRHEISHTPRFQCDICNKKFSFISALKRHKKQHQRTGKVECTHCSRSFRDEALLKRHIKYAHKGKYTCKKCNVEFHSELALSKHEKIHNAKSERKYHCRHNGCDKTFNFPHHLKHHELTHTNSKQHFCEICKKGFIQFHHLKDHMKTHEPEKWLRCTQPNCKKKFSTKYSRKRHLLRTHNIKLNESPTTDLSQCESDFEVSLKSNTFQCTDITESVDIVLDKENLSKYTATCYEHPEDLSEISQSDLYQDKPYSNEMINLNTHVNNSNPYINNFNPEKNNITSDINNINPDKNKMTSDIHNIKPLKNNITSDINNINPDINDCKSVLGGCIMNADSSDNCLCAQMKSTVDDCYEDTLITNANINSTNMASDLQPFEPPVANEAVNVGCESCECSAGVQNTCFGTTNSTKNVPNTLCSSQNNVESAIPELEYKIDGSIKLKNTFDSDIELFANVNVEIKMNTIKPYESTFVPFNSCKAVLGKCIVSGNGTMSEECLCAKMLADDQQVSAEEIDEITPQPVNSGLNSSVM